MLKTEKFLLNRLVYFLSLVLHVVGNFLRSLPHLELEEASDVEGLSFDLPCWYTEGWLATTTGLGISTTFIAGFDALTAGGGGGADFFLRPEKTLNYYLM